MQTTSIHPGTEPDTEGRRRALVSVAAAMALACVVLLLPLGRKPLTAWDEGIYAEVSREMLDGSWLVPHWNTQLWFEKPPLLLWITAMFFKLFGVNEFAARAASALSGVAIVGVLHGWLLRRSGSRSDKLAAWLSTVMLLSTLAFLHIGGLGETDVLLSLGCLMALLGLYCVQLGEGTGWYWFWMGFAAALMTKGAASIVVPFTLVVMLLLERRRLLHSDRAFSLGVLLFLVIVLPWHLYMFVHFGQAFLHEYLGLHVLSRATVQIEGHHTHAWYYLGVLLASAVPWVALYPFAIADALRKPEQRPLRVFAVFVLVALGFFTLVQTRLPHYIAPAYPPLTLLAAMYAADKLRAWRVTERPFRIQLGWALGAIAVWGLAAFLTDVPRKRLHSAREVRGAAPPDSREMARLLKSLRRQGQLPDGPLLLWTAAPVVPIAPAVFYAQRPVQQVQLGPVDIDEPTDKYLYAPKALEEETGPQPRLLMLDRSLLPSLPAGYVFHSLQAGKTMEVGSIAHPH